MKMPEVPVPEIYNIFKIRKHLIFGVPARLERAGAQRRIHKRPFAAGMGDYVIYAVAVRGQICYRLVQLLVRGHLARPPRKPRHAHGPVCAGGSAEREDLFALQHVHLPAHEVNDIRPYHLHLAAVPHADGEAVQQAEVFVIAVYEQHGERQLFIGLQVLIKAAAPPHSAKVARHYNVIIAGKALFAPTEVFKFVKVVHAVRIARHPYHLLLPPSRPRGRFARLPRFKGKFILFPYSIQLYAAATQKAKVARRAFCKLPAYAAEKLHNLSACRRGRMLSYLIHPQATAPAGINYSQEE